MVKNEVPPGSIKEIADKFQAEVSTSNDLSQSEKEAKNHQTAVITITLEDKKIDVDLVKNNQTDDQYLPVTVYYQGWMYQDDDYPDQLPTIIEQILKNQTQIRRKFIRKVLCVTNDNGDVIYWPRT